MQGSEQGEVDKPLHSPVYFYITCRKVLKNHPIYDQVIVEVGHVIEVFKVRF